MTSGPITRPRPGDATPVGIVRPIPNRELAGVDDLVDFGRGRCPRRGWVRVSVRIALLAAAAAGFGPKTAMPRAAVRRRRR